MFVTSLMQAWAGVVESVALIALIIIAIGIMVRVKKPPDAARHVGTVLCVVILLLILPAIIVNAWSSMTVWQHLGVVILGIVMGLSLWAIRQTRK